MCSCILYMHISAYAHIHIQAHSLMRALTLSCARTRARTRIHIHTTHTGARAQTRMHPGTRRPDYARPYEPAHEHACMRTHTRKHTRTCKHARYAHARNHMQTCARTTCMHAYASDICTHVPAQCSYMRTYAHARTRLHIRPHSCKHTPTYFGCALADWGHTPALDVDDVRCVHVSVRQACSGCVSGSAANALGGQNLEVCSFLCPWWFL